MYPTYPNYLVAYYIDPSASSDIGGDGALKMVAFRASIGVWQ
jgi:hypothetical protein